MTRKVFSGHIFAQRRPNSVAVDLPRGSLPEYHVQYSVSDWMVHRTGLGRVLFRNLLNIFGPILKLSFHLIRNRHRMAFETPP